MTANGWVDYKVIATGGGEKLEKWGDVVLLRPDPQVIWPAAFDLKSYKGLCAHYSRSNSGGGEWKNLKKFPESWNIKYKELTFSIKPMGFKHTGLFPEQAVNWDQMISLIKNAKREIKVLNLFGYTGGATAACAYAGAYVTHVDAAKGMVDRAKINCGLSSIPEDRVRYIVDDCQKFVMREIKRGNRYHAVIMDPPSYGRGPNGEVWKIEDSLFSLVKACMEIVADEPLFFLINSYTTGLAPGVLSGVLKLTMCERHGGSVESDEVGLMATKRGLVLPCGASGRWTL